MKQILNYAEEPKLDDLFVVKKFNQWMIEAKNEPAPKMLFGPLWLEGEIAVLSAAPGAGKSILAVQIAESIADGRPIGPMEMTAEPQKVLYMNRKMSANQFAVRYSEEIDTGDGEGKGNAYDFSDNLDRVDVDIHGKLPEGFRSFDEALPVMVERAVAKTNAKVVVIDSITYLQRSVYGYRETYTMMKALHRLKSKLGISILVLARTSKYGSVRESAAGSCSALFSRYADSVFMIGDKQARAFGEIPEAVDRPQQREDLQRIARRVVQDRPDHGRLYRVRAHRFLPRTRTQPAGRSKYAMADHRHCEEDVRPPGRRKRS